MARRNNFQTSAKPPNTSLQRSSSLARLRTTSRVQNSRKNQKLSTTRGMGDMVVRHRINRRLYCFNSQSQCYLLGSSDVGVEVWKSDCPSPADVLVSREITAKNGRFFPAEDAIRVSRGAWIRGQPDAQTEREFCADDCATAVQS